MAYAAAVASALRIRACIVTGEAAAHRCCCCGTSLRLCRHVLCWLRGMWLSAAGGQDANLSAFEGHDVHLVPTSETLTFEHSYTWWGHRRKLKVRLSTGVHYVALRQRGSIPPVGTAAVMMKSATVLQAGDSTAGCDSYC